MTTITITLPDELAKKAGEQGLLSSTAIESYVRNKLLEADADAAFDPRLEGLVNPSAFRKGEINGDIVGPFHEAWGEPK